MNSPTIEFTNPVTPLKENRRNPGIIITIGKTFLEESIKAYPILGKDKALRTLYCYLSHQSLKKSNGKEGILVDVGTLSYIEGKPNDKHYNGKAFLERFCSLVMPLTIRTYRTKEGVEYEHSFTKKRARQVYFNNPLTKYIFPGDNKVYYETFKPLIRDRVGKLEKALYKDMPDDEAISEDELKSLKDSDGNFLYKSDELSFKLIDLLNNLPSNKFTSIVKRSIPVLEDIIKNHPNKHIGAYIENILDSICHNPKPIYHASPKRLTSRIFTKNSYLNLPRNIREAMLSDCIKVDIKSSQFSIISSLWKIDSITKFLDEGGSLWKELFKWMGFEGEDEFNKSIIKDAMKRFTYSSIYGMGKGKLQSNFKHEVEELLPDINRRFHKYYQKSGRKISLGIYLSKHPFFEELFTRRTSFLQKIKRDKGITCPDGKWLALDKNTPQSLLACYAQRAEMLAMEPIINMLVTEYKLSKNKNGTNAFLCLGWLHDGLYIKVNAPELHTGMWIARLSAISHTLKERTGLSYDISCPYDFKPYNHTPKPFVHPDNIYRSSPPPSFCQLG